MYSKENDWGFKSLEINTWLQKFSEYTYCHVTKSGIKKHIIFKWHLEDICHLIYSDTVG